MKVSQIILKVGEPKIISAQILEQKFLICFFFFLHNMPNRYKFAEIKYGRFDELLNAM